MRTAGRERCRSGIARLACLGAQAMSFPIELFRFLGSRKKYWLMPVAVMTVGLGGLVVLSQGSVVAPFIYALF
jgi:hypothetical protein